MKSTITIRIGAAADELIVDGHTFDRSKFDRKQRRALSEYVTGALFANWNKGKDKRGKAFGKRNPR